MFDSGKNKKKIYCYVDLLPNPLYYSKKLQGISIILFVKTTENIE